MKQGGLCYCIAAACVVPALAQTSSTTNSPHTFTGNAAIASQYVFRGLSQTNGKPAIQGEFDYAHASGWYAGTWLSNISWFTDQNAGIRSAPVSLASPSSVGLPYLPNRSNQASLEWDLYGGYKGSSVPDMPYDVGAIRYLYPGRYDNVGAYRNPDTTELYASAGYQWLSIKYSKAISRYTFGVNESRGASYVDLTATVPMGDSGYTLVAHVGRQDYPGRPNAGYWGNSGGNNNYFDYTDYKMGLSREVAGFVVSAAYTYANTRNTAPDGDTTAYMNAFGRNIGRSRFAVVASRSF